MAKKYSAISVVLEDLGAMVKQSPLPNHLKGQISNIVYELDVMPQSVRDKLEKTGGGSSALHQDG
jgi:hypothetical protein